LKWSELPAPWQICWEQAWEACRRGSLPIGAAITDARGEIVASGRNHINDGEPGPGQRVTGSQLAHAELNALLNIPVGLDPYTMMIHSLIEPCPLCMGAIYMSGVRSLEYAGADPYAGSTNLLRKTWYLARKPVRAVQTSISNLAAAAEILHTTALWMRFPEGSHIVETMAWTANPRVEKPARYLIETNTLAIMRAADRGAVEVFDQIVDLLEGMDHDG